MEAGRNRVDFCPESARGILSQKNAYIRRGRLAVRNAIYLTAKPHSVDRFSRPCQTASESGERANERSEVIQWGQVGAARQVGAEK